MTDDLEEIVSGDVRSQLCHRLPSGTTHSEEEGVALWLPQDPADPGDVFDGVQEHYKWHGLL